MKRRTTRTGLWARWLWLVYLPLGLMLVFFGLFVLGRLPGQAVPILAGLSVWGLIAVRLLFERRKIGLHVPPPKKVMLWITTLGALVLVGAMLFWAGADRLSTNVGVVMVVVGGFLMILAVTAPAFKLIDLVLRRIARLMKRIVARIT